LAKLKSGTLNLAALQQCGPDMDTDLLEARNINFA